MITGIHRPAVYHLFIAAGKGAIPEIESLSLPNPQNFNSLPPRGLEQRVLLTRTNHLGSSRFKATRYLRFHLRNLTRKD